MDRDILKEQLRTVDQSLFFLMLIILSVLLSFWSVRIQREQLEKELTGDWQEAAVPDIFSIRLTASALTVGSLVYFFSLSLRTLQDAVPGNDPAAQKSAGMNVWASLFVLAAALIRLYDLNFTKNVQPSLIEEDTQPE